MKNIKQPISNFREEDIDYEPRRNLAHIAEKRNRNSISAQQLGSRERRAPIDLNSDELYPDRREYRHNPLPPTKVERAPNFNDSRDLYKVSSKKLLLDSKKL